MALQKLFYVEGDVREKVDAFQYLGQILTEDDDDIRVIRSQVKKSRCIWARVSQILKSENTPPKVSAKFYLAVVQSVLLWQQILEPDKGRSSMAGGLQHSSRIQDGCGKQTLLGPAPDVSVPMLKGCAQ